MPRLRTVLLATAAATAGCCLAGLPAVASAAAPAPAPAWTLESIDKTGDRLLSPQEFTKAWLARGGDPREAAEAFQKADTDRNGYLCAKEFPKIPDPRRS
ncbi:EF-hand domain-containing protein [Streptomyces sp. ODS28]|uniref:EF-hand domain-containing protein n=1 Tax=Streptomyces sp. ODS28 TaxID=3136688 RepID=UPI0031EB3375